MGIVLAQVCLLRLVLTQLQLALVVALELAMGALRG